MIAPLLLPARTDSRRLNTGPRIIPSGEIILQSAVSGAIPGVDINYIWCTDASNLLRQLPAKSVHCIVTSPPYWNLRDYGVSGQMGSESTPQAYVEALVCLFREIRRVLRDDGTIFLNLGDTYVGDRSYQVPDNKHKDVGNRRPMKSRNTGLLPKSMALIPFRVAIALQDDGWIIRSDIIWAKPNCMPESVKDRPTKAHEYIFLITKEPYYFYDAEAIKEEAKEESAARARRGVSEDNKHVVGAPGQTVQSVHKARKNERLGKRQYDGFNERWDAAPAPLLRNSRSVWTISPKPLPFDHYAAFPEELAERMILAGCPETTCSACGAPWVRQSEKEFIPQGDVSLERGKHRGKFYHEHSWGGFPRGITNVITTGWKPTCACNAPTKPGLVLDPFVGSGTTALVARVLGRSYIGSELNPAYVAIARERLRQPFEQHYIQKETKLDDLPLFALDGGMNVKEP